MKRDLRKKVGGLFLGGAAMLVILGACGGSTGETAAIPTATQTAATATATAAPTPSPTPPAAPTATVAPVLTPSPVAANNDLLTRGKLLFEKTAGGVGCASCHGLDGKGSKTVGAPDNRGASEAQVRAAIAGGVPMMSFIKLTDDEIAAVVAYLKYLNEQPQR